MCVHLANSLADVQAQKQAAAVLEASRAELPPRNLVATGGNSKELSNMKLQPASMAVAVRTGKEPRQRGF